VSALTDAALDIPNLLYRYADAIDAGRFDEAAALFDHGSVLAGGRRVQGREALVALWRGWVRLYPDGTPRTRHLITNPRIELAADRLGAHCHSQWTVLQATEGLPLQVIGSGRYQDRLAVIEGRWQFVERVYAGMDLMGNLSAHLLMPLTKQGD
jgi:3-phenylpropionate/cinnamic acid dioxygenase small subunit